MSKVAKIAGEKDDKFILTIKRIFCYIVLILIAVISLIPFYILIVNASRSHSEIQKGFTGWFGKSILYNIKSLLDDKNIPVISSIKNSLIVSVGVAFLSTYFSALTAYGIHAYNFRFKKFAFSFILVIMMVPAQVSALGFIDLMTDFGLMNTFIPLIVPAIAAPATFFFMKQYMDSSLPLEIVEAARIDGCREFKTFNFIIMPLLKPAMAVQGIFTFVGAWNNYFMPALILETKENKTLPIIIAELRSADFMKFDMGKVYILIAIAIVPLIIVYLFLSKFIIRGIALGSVKG